MASKRRSSGPASEGVGPWLGVRSVADPYAVPPNYLSDASNVYLPDGKGGSGAYARPGFRRVIVLPGSQVSDAIVRGRLVWIDSMSAGKAQSIGGGQDDRPYGRYTLINGGGFTFSDSGGPDAGGQITATLVDSSLVVQEITTERVSENATLGVTARLGTLVSETVHRHGSILVWHNLNGQAIAAPSKILDLGHMQVVVNPDLTLTVQQKNTVSILQLTTIQTSALTVPATGWFLMEYQWGISPLYYDKGGFFKARRYVPAITPVIGESILDIVGTRTRGEFNGVFEYSFGPLVYVPLHTSIGGIGAIIPDGTAPRWYYELYLGVALPTADGDTVQSHIDYEHHEYFGYDMNGDPQLVGTDLVWGDAARWKNVRSIAHSAIRTEEPLHIVSVLGHVTVSTSQWTSGPTYPTDSVVRNSLLNAEMDLMRVGFTKQHEEIVALGPFALAAWRYILPAYDSFIVGNEFQWLLTGPKPLGFGVSPITGGNFAYELVMKLATGELVTNRGSMGNSEWRTLPGYQSSLPGVIERNWSAGSLPQPGIRGDFRVLDAIEDLDPANRWVQVDVAQVGLDVAYRKRAAPATVFEAQPPIADFFVTVDGISHGAITIQDASVDFNGDENATVTGVTSRVMNWGDGTIETIGTGFSHQASHQYALHGTHVAVLTAANGLGLSNTKTMSFVVPVGTALAGFSATTHSADVSGLTMDFADVSSVQNGTVAAWTWNFGDGNTSTLQNPTHAYLAPGTYTVVLTVTGDSGQTDDFSAPVTVPVVVDAGGCGLTPEAKTNPATVGVQADDFAGGNARFINYLSSTNLRAYLVDRTPYRALYQFLYTAEDSEIELDTVETFNGRPSLKIAIHGDGYGGWDSEFSNDTTNLGDDSDFSNDAVTDLWLRIIFKLNQQAIDLVNAIDPVSSNGNGLQLAAPGGPSNYNPIIFANGGHAYQQIQTRLTAEAGQTIREIVDLGTFPSIVNKDWCELIMYLGCDEGAHTQRNMAWLGAACSLDGVSPLCDRTNPSFTSHSGGGFLLPIRFEWVDWMYYFNSGAAIFSDPKPGANISLVEIHRVPLLTNPFGVALT